MNSIFNLLTTKTSSYQFGVHPFTKIFLYFEIRTSSPALDLGSLSLTSFLKSIYVLSLTSTGFILIVLWYVLLYSFTISFSFSIDRFFDIEVMFYRL